MKTLPRQGPSRSVRAVLRKQQRRSILLSAFSSLLLVPLLLVALALITWKSRETSFVTLTVTTNPLVEDQSEEKKPRLLVRTATAPRAPSAAKMSRILAIEIPTASWVPVPEITSDSLSFNLGMEEGLGDSDGDGWGINLANQLVKERPDIARNPDDTLDRSGSAPFFGQTVQAGRVVYVIQMGGKMGGLHARWHYMLEQEFPKAIQRMKSDKMLVGIMFFGGPASSIGDTVSLTMSDDFKPIPKMLPWDYTRGAIVSTQDGREFHWRKKTENRIGWEHDGPKQVIPWYEVTPKSKAWFLKILPLMDLRGPLYQDTWDSVWDNALNLALDMSPPPEEIVFVAASAGPGPDTPRIWVDEIGPRAKEMGVKINCLGIIAPQLETELNRLARMTGGQCKMVDIPMIVAAQKNKRRK